MPEQADFFERPSYMFRRGEGEQNNQVRSLGGQEGLHGQVPLRARGGGVALREGEKIHDVRGTNVHPQLYPRRPGASMCASTTSRD